MTEIFDETAEIEAAERDGTGCLAVILGSTVRGGGSLASLVMRADLNSLDRRTLATHGVCLSPGGAWAVVGIADRHPFLEALFCDTPFIGNWRRALLTLPGARPGSPVLFGRLYSASVTLPRVLFGLETTR